MTSLATSVPPLTSFTSGGRLSAPDDLAWARAVITSHRYASVMEDAMGATRAHRRQSIAFIVMTLVAIGSVVLAVDNAVGHRWVSMTGNLLVAISMAFGLFAQRQLNKQRVGRTPPS